MATPIRQPAENEVVRIAVAAGAELFLDFAPESATVSLADGDLVFRFEDGGIIVLEGFEAAARSARSVQLQLQSGEILAGQGIVEIAAEAEEFLAIPTEAGDETLEGSDQGSGSTVYADTLGDVVQTIQEFVGARIFPATFIDFQPPPRTINVAAASDFPLSRPEPFVQPVNANEDSVVLGVSELLETPQLPSTLIRQDTQELIRVIEDENLLRNDDGPGLTLTSIGLGTSPPPIEFVPVPATEPLTIVGMWGELTVSSNGDYTYIVTDPMSLPPNEALTERFTYEVTGDNNLSDTAALTINFNPDAFDDAGQLAESGKADGTFIPTSTSGDLLVNDIDGAFPPDDPPIVEAVFLDGYDADLVELQGGNGDPFVFTGRRPTTGDLAADPDDIVWRLTLQENGKYHFELLQSFQHDLFGDGEKAPLDFRYKIQDVEGFSDTATLTVSIEDDVPVANPDTILAEPNGVTVFGNVIQGTMTQEDGTVISTDPDAIDFLGADGARLDEVKLGDESADVPDGGAATIVGESGTLKIFSDGRYEFTPLTEEELQGKGADSFSYVLIDGDGDTDETMLEVDFKPIAVDDPDPLAERFEVQDAEVVDTVSGNLIDNDAFGTDGQGVPPIVDIDAGPYAPGGTKVGVTKSMTVTGNDKKFVFTSDDGVWRLDADATGEFTFTLLQPYDHSLPVDDAKAFQTFTYAIQDGDGDTDTAMLTIEIIDDVPVANADTNVVQPDGAVVFGNVIAGTVTEQDGTVVSTDRDAIDSPGADSAGVKEVTFGMQTVAVPEVGSATIPGAFGELQMTDDGAYSYTLNDPPPAAGGTETFEYTLIDDDGDKATTALTITIEAAPPPSPAFTTSFRLDSQETDRPIQDPGRGEVLRVEQLFDPSDDPTVDLDGDGRPAAAVGQGAPATGPLAGITCIGPCPSPQEPLQEIHSDLS